jgi:hypothetical protein
MFNMQIQNSKLFMKCLFYLGIHDYFVIRYSGIRVFRFLQPFTPSIILYL